MSLISDALKKAEQQRLNPSPANTTNWNLPPSVTVQGQPEARHSSSRSLFIGNLVALVAVCAVAVYFFQVRPQQINAFTSEQAGGSSQAANTATTPAAVPATEAPAAPAPTYAATQSVPAPESTAAANTASVAGPPTTTDYELGGTSGVGSTTLLSIVRRDDKRSLWVPVGKTVAEVTAVSYDPESDRAVIRVRGNLMTVVTREASGKPASSAQAAE